MSRKAELLDKLALILATTQQDSVAMAAFKAMRLLHPRGSLFVVRPFVVTNPKVTTSLDDIRDQVYADLDAGLPYTRIAVAMRIDHRKAKLLRDAWRSLPEHLKQQRRQGWSEERRQRRDVLDDARDEGHNRVVARFRPTLQDDEATKISTPTTAEGA